ncbi:cytochrome P450 reductase [Leishmania donovani]|uniref:Cytochrome_P450_reductase_putative/GeneDB:LmjF.35.2560 n=1 Tax=Leishmania donovani TaxID=5661 RepID=A0A504XGU8_LEIDO|nr:FAD binding domain family protein [Leishmania donovani]CAJ1993068.1 cytochrome P450 reductase [Leishmania donovani]VDZ48896.1 cytochrome_P450_reductase_putative/GeneDB:LmjF.35.2560 [Leishmania donovani]
MAQKRYVALVGALVLGATSAVLLMRQWRVQRERREFAERYAKQIKAAREAHAQSLNGGSASPDSADISDADFDDEAAAVKVIFGSESGNAEGLAKGFVMTLRDRGVQAALIDPSRWAYMEDYLYHNKRNVPLFHPIKVVSTNTSSAEKGSRKTAEEANTPRPPLVYIFIVATAGEGEPTGNFMALFQEMQSAVRRATTAKVPAQSSAVTAGAAPSSATEEAPFKNIYYAVFGLGDSSYKYYCRSATDTNTLLKKGGGINVHRVGFGDARHGMQEDVFDEWQEKVMLALEEKCGLEMTTGTRAPPKPELQFRFLSSTAATTAATTSTVPQAGPCGAAEGTAAPSTTTITNNADPNRSVLLRTATPSSAVAAESTSAPPISLPFPPPPVLLEPSLMNPTRIRLVTKTQLSPPRDSDGSSVYRFCFETDGTGISYQAGDHLGIFPTSPPEMVARCAKALSIPAGELETPVELCEMVPSRGIFRNVLPARVPLRVVLQRYVDLCGRPKKSTLRVLAKYCTDPVQQEAFLELLRLPAEKEAEEAAAGSCAAWKPKKLRTVVDYLEKFPSCCCIPLGHFIEVMPRTQPRYYSIASDRMSHGTKVEIIVRVLTDGLASSYLAHRIEEGDEVFAYVRITTFHLPQRIGEKRPVLMIGPGTGAAAMVGFCYRKEALMRKQPAAHYGPTVFLFGAQRRQTEYFVEEEVQRWAMAPAEMKQWDADHPTSHAGLAARRSKTHSWEPLPASVITTVDCAFSRDQEEKRYVTSLIDKHKDLIYEMLTSTAGGGCLVFLSGEASVMAKDVDRALVALLQDRGGMTRLAALEFLRRMESDHRYLKDVY